MNTSIKISNQSLPSLLARIGEALGNGEDLILHQSINESTGNRYVYTEIPGERKRILEMEGEDKIKVNQEEGMSFTNTEISLMEETKTCPETEDQVDHYYCNYLCPIRETCQI